MTRPTVPNEDDGCTHPEQTFSASTGTGDLAPLPASSQYWGWTAEAIEAAAVPDPLATVHQLPGTEPLPAPPTRRPDRDQRRDCHPQPGSPDRFALLPEHLLRDKQLSAGAVRLYAELQRQIGVAPPAYQSLQLCTVTVGQLAANIHAGQASIRVWLADLAAGHHITYRAEDDRRRGLRVAILWIAPKRP